MKLAFLFFGNKPDIKWKLCSQMGVKYAIAKLAPELTGERDISDFETLRKDKELFASEGFELIGLEGDQFDMTRIKLGLDGREEDAERYRRMLLNMGRLGITTLCYNFMPLGWFRTAKNIEERGGALVTGFDSEDALKLGDSGLGKISAEQLWDNYRWFIEQVMPTAEAAGVRMALHPDDPPVADLRGVARIFIDAGSIRKALSVSDSPSHCLTFCQGTYKTMGEDIPALIREWSGRIAFVHIRDVEGTPGHFHETFHDNGPTDMAAMLKEYADAGFDGIIRSDHVPTMAGEDNSLPSYGMNGNLFGIGYIKGLADGLGIELE